MALTYTLLTDGRSDAVLGFIIDWVLAQHLAGTFSGDRADLGRLPRPPRSLAERIASAVRLHPCDILIVHRDAERESREVRVREIVAAADAALPSRPDQTTLPVVCAVPVRMTEAWLLAVPSAIEAAVGARQGSCVVPPLHKLESLPDPKQTLAELLREISPLGARRLRRLDAHVLIHRVASLIQDFSPLRELAAFATFEMELVQAVRGFSQGVESS